MPSAPTWSRAVAERPAGGPTTRAARWASIALKAKDTGAKMTESRSPIYTAEAHVTGGRAEGHGRTSDGALEVDMRIPAEMGGPGGGTNPEQLFAVGYAACFESALAVIGRRMKAEVGDVAIESAVSLLPDGKGGFKLEVGLDVN